MSETSWWERYVQYSSHVWLMGLLAAKLGELQGVTQQYWWGRCRLGSGPVDRFGRQGPRKCNFRAMEVSGKHEGTNDIYG